MRRSGRFKKLFHYALYRLFCGLALLVVMVGMVSAPWLRTVPAMETAPTPAWSQPGAKAIKWVGEVSSTRHHPSFLTNLDCATLTYRLPASSTMQTGCFTPTAFGLFDSSSRMVIFNGTDEALPLETYGPHEILVPWPKALNLLVASSASTGGSYLNMYDNPLSVMRDERNVVGQLTGKRLTAGPDHLLRTPSGQPLIVNTQATAFSDTGSWAVVETIYGYFARVNLASLEMVPFGPSFSTPGGSAPADAQVAISHDGRFVAVANGSLTTLDVYDLATCSGNKTSWQTNACQSYKYWPYASQQISGLRSLGHLRFINDGLLSFEGYTNGAATGSVYELAPSDSIGFLTDYLGLGDSYTSGEGAFDYLAGTDTKDNTCHLSARSYPLLLTADLFNSAGGHSVACSGAVIKDIGGSDGSYHGQVQHGASLEELQTGQAERLRDILADYSPGYVPQIFFAQKYQPRVMTVSIGGNDIGFGDILERCVVPHISRHTSDGICYNTFESRQEVVSLVDRTVPRWTVLYRQLQATAPGSTVYVVGYPSIASDLGSCPLNVNLSKSELEFAEELIHYLNGSIQQAASAAGVPYVDISHALDGHRLCEANGSAVAVNGLTAGKDFGAFGFGVLGRESYHPNALGHALIEQTILRQTHNLSVISSPSTPPDSHNLLNAPHSGRQVYTIMPTVVTERVIAAGKNASLKVNGGETGLRPGTTYTVHIDGPTGPVLGSLSADANGAIAGTVYIPQDTSPGGHTIDIVGPGQEDQPVDITQPIYVPAADNDSDGDAVDDTHDTCPYAYNSGQDADKDGIDDICDPLIVPPLEVNAAPAVGTLATSTGEPTNSSRSLFIQGPVLVTQSVLSKPFKSRVLGWSKAGPDPSGDSKFYVMSLSIKHRVETKRGDRWPWLLALLAAILTFCQRRRIIKFWRDYSLKLCNNWPKIDYKNCSECFTIVIMRKFGVIIFAALLFASLLTLAFSTSSNIALTNPSKVEKWLNDSNLYGAFIENAIHQAEQTAGTDQSGGVSLSDAVVKQAAESSFSSDALGQDVKTFLDSNYAWLNGKTKEPSFRIDLADAKQNFAEKVGTYVTTYLNGLQPCTPEQTAQIDPQTADPLTLECRPSGMDPTAVGAQVTEQLASSTQFLSDPVVTAANVNPNGSIDSPSQPYYEQFSSLPSAYQKATKVPWVAGVLALVSLLLVLFIAPRKRQAVKVIAVVLGLAGLVMVTTKFVADRVFRDIQNNAFNENTVGELQKALTVFMRHAEDQLVKIDLWFGIGYLVLAAILVGALIITRQRGLRIPKRLQNTVPVDKDASEVSASAPQPKPTTKPRRQKPPRLVQ